MFQCSQFPAQLQPCERTGFPKSAFDRHQGWSLINRKAVGILSYPAGCNGFTFMSYPKTLHEQRQGPVPEPLLQERSPRTGSPALARRSRKRIEEVLNQLGAQLTRPDELIGASEIDDMLLLLSADIRFGAPELASSDYRWIVDQLTGIYAQGFEQRPGDLFTKTARSYAHLIETISRAYPGNDYSEAVGQLFCYMSRLFRTRKHDWKAVYEHLLSIPDSVEAKQMLNRAFFAEIQEWAEAGVENLFSIRMDLYEKIGAIKDQIRRLDRRIEMTLGGIQLPEQTSSARAGTNVVDLAAARRERLIGSLRFKRQRLLEEKDDEEIIVGLIESDIREFEDKLRATRRAYFIYLV